MLNRLPKWLYSFAFPPTTNEFLSLRILTSYHYTPIILMFWFAIPQWHTTLITFSYNCHSNIFFGEVSVYIFFPFKKNRVVLSLMSFVNSLRIVDMCYQICVLQKIFSQFVVYFISKQCPLEALLRILDYIWNAMGSHWKVLSDRVTSDSLCEEITACKVESGGDGTNWGRQRVILR